MTQDDFFIGCAVCLNIDNSKRNPASTIVKGYSVCETHVPLVSNPKFDIARIQGGKS